MKITIFFFQYVLELIGLKFLESPLKEVSCQYVKESAREPL